MFYTSPKTILEGEDLLNPLFPGASWNISALFEHDELVFHLVNLMNDLLQCPNPIASVHGCLPLRWNSGRVGGKMRSTSEMESLFLTYKELGIKVFLTFSNHFIEEADLEDQTCNYLLEQLSGLGEGNGVIVASDLLSNYIHENFPDLAQVSSILKVTVENGKGNAKYYRSLTDRFSRVVIHLDDNFNHALLKQLEPGKVEVLVNEPCILNCPNRVKHYNVLSKMSRDYYNVFEYDDMEMHIGNVCQAVPLIKQLNMEKQQRNCTLTFKELQAINALGITHYKIQGRNEKHTMFLYDLVRYLFEPDYIAPLVFKIMLTEDWES